MARLNAEEGCAVLCEAHTLILIFNDYRTFTARLYVTGDDYIQFALSIQPQAYQVNGEQQWNDLKEAALRAKRAIGSSMILTLPTKEGPLLHQLPVCSQPTPLNREAASVSTRSHTSAYL
jgi:hypothetical protein